MIRLRPLAEGDLPALAALEATCFADPWSCEGLSILLRAPYRGIVALDGETVVGYIGYSHFPAMGDCPAEGEIARIAVDPRTRRCGIGRRLLGAMLDSLGSPATAYLDVRASNHAAQALYAAAGFVERGMRPRFYGDEDALEMAWTSRD